LDENDRGSHAHSWRGGTPLWHHVAAGMSITLLLVLMQYRSGAYSSDLTSDPDEPAHAVSSLMVRDYLAQAFPANPVAFARDFAAHYSKVAIGHWPPLFYCGEGLWMLAAGRSRVAMLLFVGLCGAALVFSVYSMVRRYTSIPVAPIGIGVLIYPREFGRVLATVRPEMLLALVVFWAAVQCGKYMSSGNRKSRNFFLVLTATALLVHGRAGVLLLLPFCLLPLRTRASRWKWAASGVFLTLLFVVLPFVGQTDGFSLRPALFRTSAYVIGIYSNMGWPALALALTGATLAFRASEQRPFWAAMAALPLCGLVFQLLATVHYDERNLITVLPALAVLAGGGVQVLLDGMRTQMQRMPRIACAIVALAALAWLAPAVARVQKKQSFGYRKLVAECVLCGHTVSLIGADATNEGGLIAEASLSDPSRTRTVLRSSKALAHSTWSGKYYRLLFASPPDVLHFLDAAGVSLVVVQAANPRPDIVQLRSALALDPSVWKREASSIAGMDVYRRAAGDSAYKPQAVYNR